MTMIAFVRFSRQFTVALAIFCSPVFVLPAEAKPANTLREMFSQLSNCLRAAHSYSDPEFEVTIVFSLKRDGSVFGKPRVSHIKLAGDEQKRKEDLVAILRGFDQCLPLNLTEAMGGAVAGRQIAFRFAAKLREDDA